MNEKTNILSFVLITFLLLASSVVAGTGNFPYGARIDSLFKEWDNPNSPGAALVIVKDGKTIYKNEYGMANLEYGIPISSTTIFHVGSVSKQFTAFSILLLADQGKLSLDDDITKYLPELKGPGKSIKIRHLLHHTNGLREQEHLLQICGISSADNISTDQLFRLISRQKKLNFAPGDEIEYCNTGYFLLALIVERVTGESFRDWTRENIFDPLGMDNSQFYDDNTRIVVNRAYPYWIPEGDSAIVKGILNYSYVGPTGLFTTSEDFAKWLINLETATAGNEDILNKLKTETGKLNNGEVLTYGYGIGVTEYKGMKTILHSGQDAGYRAIDIYFTEHKLGVAILSNFYSISPMELAHKIADIVLADFITESEAAAEEEFEAGSSESIDTSLIAKEQMADFEGRYYSEELETVYTIDLYGEKLIARHWRNDDVILTPEDIDEFSGNQRWFRKMDFLRDVDGKVIGFDLTTNRVRNLRFDKVNW